MKDRLLGYTVIVIVTLFLLLPIGYIKWKTSMPFTTRTIAFSGVRTLSFLSVQDPVSVQGVVIGVVLDVYIQNDTAYVKIEMLDKIDLHEDYSITVVSKGVMGERYLNIIPGDERKPVVSPDRLLLGKVNIGPDDALAYMAQLKSAVNTLAKVSEVLKNGSAQKLSLVRQIRQFTADIDSIIRSMVSLLTKIDASLKHGVDSTLAFTEKTIDLTRKITDNSPATIETLNNLLHSMEKAVVQVDSLITQADSVIERAEDPNHIMWKQYSGSIHENLTKLHELLKQIECDPIALPVRLW